MESETSGEIDDAAAATATAGLIACNACLLAATVTCRFKKTTDLTRLSFKARARACFCFVAQYVDMLCGYLIFLITGSGGSLGLVIFRSLTESTIFIEKIRQRKKTGLERL